MKTLYIEALKRIDLDKEKLQELAHLLPSTIYIVYSIQNKPLSLEVMKYLEKSGKKVLGISQVLGCSKLETNAEAILLIGEARFHALNLAISSSKEVIVFDNYSISKISKEEIEKQAAREKGKYLRFLSEREIGILVSSKPGQENIDAAIRLKRELQKQDKKPFLFISDNLLFSELENFPLYMYVNTACPGLSLDSPKILNLSTIEKLKSLK
jgi:2-(3-amino-3-carboxypropyl)histidine synthase